MYNVYQQNTAFYNGVIIQRLLSEGVVLSDAASKTLEKALVEASSFVDSMTRMLTIRRVLVESSLFLTDAQGNISVKGIPEQVILNDWLTITESQGNTDFTQ